MSGVCLENRLPLWAQLGSIVLKKHRLERRLAVEILQTTCRELILFADRGWGWGRWRWPRGGRRCAARLACWRRWRRRVRLHWRWGCEHRPRRPCQPAQVPRVGPRVSLHYYASNLPRETQPIHGDQLGISLFPTFVIRRRPRPSRPITQTCLLPLPRVDEKAMCRPFGA